MNLWSINCPEVEVTRIYLHYVILPILFLRNHQIRVYWLKVTPIFARWHRDCRETREIWICFKRHNRKYAVLNYCFVKQNKPSCYTLHTSRWGIVSSHEPVIDWLPSGGGHQADVLRFVILSVLFYSSHRRTGHWLKVTSIFTRFRCNTRKIWMIQNIYIFLWN